MSLLRIAKAPLLMSPTATVMEAVDRMQQADVDVVVVCDTGGQLRGMLTERDVMLGVLLPGKDPEHTLLQDVMSTDVVTAPIAMQSEDAIRTMRERQLSRLPVVREDGTVAGIVEVRELFFDQFEELRQQLDSLQQYFAADGIGG